MARPHRAIWIFLLLPLVVVLLVITGTLSPSKIGDRWRDEEAPISPSSIFSPPPGVYADTLLVELTPLNAEGQIVFTTDGTIPSPTVGMLYQQPIRIDAEHPDVTIVRAVEVVNGIPGPVYTASYAVGLDAKLPVVSLVAEPADLWDSERGIFVNTWERGQDWERSVHLTYLDPDKGLRFSVPGGLRIHGAEPFDAHKQSFRLYFRNDYGVAQLDYPLFADHPKQPETSQSYKRLLLQSGDRSGHWTLFRDQLVARIATDLGLGAAQGHFVQLFVNGEAWGIYRLSERIDRFFLEANYGIQRADVVQNGKAREGSDDEWDALLDWAEVHDLSDDANYAYVKTRIDLDNFTDFAVLQLYFDFPSQDLFAVRSRAGRWFWVYGGGSQEFAQYPEAPFSALKVSEYKDDFALLLRQLLGNPQYRQLFSLRAADLLNTVLEPAALSREVTDLAQGLSADIRYEAARWPLPLSWEENVQLLQAFVKERPEYLRSEIMEISDVQTCAALRLAMGESGGGRIFVNGFSIDTLPWEGCYFTGADVQVIAVPDPGYVFSGWQRSEDAGTVARILSPNLTLTLTDSLYLEATFETWPLEDEAGHPDDVIFNELWINDDGTRYATVDDRPIEGDWFELLVRRPDTVDLRGWRVTDNDTKTGLDEGSLVFPWLDVLSAVPRNTVILVLATESAANAAYFPQDDFDAADGQLLFYVGNGNLDTDTDAGFGIGTGDDNLVLLAPGATAAFADDIGVDFVAEDIAVTPYTFGVLEDGVIFDEPFHRLGRDDGAFFTGTFGNDDIIDWVVDPPMYQSGDAFRLDSTNIVTPGALNTGQHSGVAWENSGFAVAGLILGSFLFYWLRNHAVEL